jgi:hypothetical protein
MASSVGTSAIDLYWLPLGAGGHSVRLNGRIFEWVAARIEHRDRCDLYHSALEVRLREGRFVIEQAPAWSEGGERGVVAVGPVGTRAAGRFRLFRYEIRRWRDGVIPDVAEAVESPRRLSDDAGCARRLLELVPQVPTPRLGSRRTPHRRDVELELAHFMADRPQRPRRRFGRTSDWRTRAGLVGRHRRGTPRASESCAGGDRRAGMRKDVREFIRRLEAVGLTVEPTPGHYRVLREGKPLRKANGMRFTLPFSPDTIRWRRTAIVELRKLGIDL